MPRLIWVFAGRTSHFIGFVVLRLNHHSLYTDATKLVDDIACVLKQKDWVEEDYLLLSWTLPANVSRYTDSDLYVTARW